MKPEEVRITPPEMRQKVDNATNLKTFQREEFISNCAVARRTTKNCNSLHI
jgi:hypothetical protein